MPSEQGSSLGDGVVVVGAIQRFDPIEMTVITDRVSAIIGHWSSKGCSSPRAKLLNIGRRRIGSSYCGEPADGLNNFSPFT
jgi:hypothetical protein